MNGLPRALVRPRTEINRQVGRDGTFRNRSVIDICSENLIPIHDVPSHVPPKARGRRVHISTVYRWILRGVRGARLEVVKIGGVTYTSKEAIQEFVNRSSDAARGSLPTTASVTAQRQRQIDEAAQKVDEIFRDKKSRRRSD